MDRPCLHRPTYRCTNHDNIHVRGFTDEGTITMPFDNTVLGRPTQASRRKTRTLVQIDFQVSAISLQGVRDGARHAMIVCCKPLAADVISTGGSRK